MAEENPMVHPLAWHLFKVCEGGRELIQGPVVPDGEVWELTSMHAKNNSGLTREINVAVYDGHEWICLGSRADARQYDGAAWSGSVIMGPGWRLGCWFRDAAAGVTLQCDATMAVRYELMNQ